MSNETWQEALDAWECEVECDAMLVRDHISSLQARIDELKASNAAFAYKLCAELEEKQASIDSLAAEVEDQARLLGASGSREAKLQARIDALETDRRYQAETANHYEAKYLNGLARIDALEKAGRNIVMAHEEIGEAIDACDFDLEDTATDIRNKMIRKMAALLEAEK